MLLLSLSLSVSLSLSSSFELSLFSFPNVVFLRPIKILSPFCRLFLSTASVTASACEPERTRLISTVKVACPYFRRRCCLFGVVRHFPFCRQKQRGRFVYLCPLRRECVEGGWGEWRRRLLFNRDHCLLSGFQIQVRTPNWKNKYFGVYPHPRALCSLYVLTLGVLVLQTM